MDRMSPACPPALVRVILLSSLIQVLISLGNALTDSLGSNVYGSLGVPKPSHGDTEN